ncbi:MAG: transcriptional repressor NrdR [Phycisphaerae bacterium]|nr:transcriptional repressor NrdR [Phycisphaerae bacterium]
MRCPFCKELGSDRVIDSRLSDAGASIRRRRECESCGRRFTTKERIETGARVLVVKKDGTRVPYDRGKLIAGLQKACYKRTVSEADLEKLAEKVEDTIFQRFDREVSSQFVGEQAARLLRDLDQIAYVRFASVYRQFQDLGDFVEEVEDVRHRAETESPDQQTLF